MRFKLNFAGFQIDPNHFEEGAQSTQFHLFSTQVPRQRQVDQLHFGKFTALPWMRWATTSVFSQRYVGGTSKGWNEKDFKTCRLQAMARRLKAQCPRLQLAAFIFSQDAALLAEILLIGRTRAAHSLLGRKAL